MKNHGFTLIEVLIIVAVIGILSAIAIPNYINSQIRSKVARAKAEERIIGIAFESYAVDWDAYPHDTLPGWPYYISNRISTPIPYLTEGVLYDPFPVNSAFPIAKRYRYKNMETDPIGDVYTCLWTPLPGTLLDQQYLGKWVIYSSGPWRKLAIPDGFADGHTEGDWLWLPYDPTNGILSFGNVIGCQAKEEVNFSSETRTYTVIL